MRKGYFALIPFFLLSACQTNKVVPGPKLGDDKYYAMFMYNYPRMDMDTPSGNPGGTENLLYYKEEITLGQLISKPVKDPERTNYEFQGWFKEKDCLNGWNFDSDKPDNSVFLYAKWGITKDTDEYVEPEYVYPETIISEGTFNLTGILNSPVSDNKVDLTNGALNRLKAHASDVRFAINYERRADITMTSATYDEEDKKINVSTSNGENFEVAINNVTAALSVAEDNAYYETKAQNYEAASGEYENYHVMLAGSSSIENWSTSKEDMAPIVSYNHGIGGTTVEQWTNKLFQRLVAPYSPKVVAYYVGVNNIINANKDGQTTGKALEQLFEKTHQWLPHTKVFYILINKLPGYASFQTQFDIANEYALEFEKTHDWLTCIDAGVGLLKENGKPHWGYFMTDGLHMSKYGYTIWGAAVKKAIMDYLG